MLLSACATDGQRTRAEGAAAGAGLGAAAGAAVGGDSGSAVAGAVIGGLMGLFVGDHVANTKQRYAVEEDELRKSAQRATALARRHQEQNELLERDIAQLEQRMQQLRSEALSAAQRQTLAVTQREQLRSLLAASDGRLGQLREEIARQSALADKAQAERVRATRGAPQPPATEGIRLVSDGVRDLEQQQRVLERARLQLQLIDQRRSY